MSIGKSIPTSMINRQFLTYTVIGAGGTAAHYMVLLVGAELIGIGVMLSTFLGSIVGAAVNYILNYKITFKSTERHIVAAPKFFFLAAVAVVLNYSLMYLATEKLQVQYLIAQVSVSLIILILNYILNKKWTFRD